MKMKTKIRSIEMSMKRNDMARLEWSWDNVVDEFDDCHDDGAVAAAAKVMMQLR